MFFLQCAGIWKVPYSKSSLTVHSFYRTIIQLDSDSAQCGFGILEMHLGISTAGEGYLISGIHLKSWAWISDSLYSECHPAKARQKKSWKPKILYEAKGELDSFAALPWGRISKLNSSQQKKACPHSSTSCRLVCGWFLGSCEVSWTEQPEH